MFYFLMVSFPDGLVPAETFVDPQVFQSSETAIKFARDLLDNENAKAVTVYCAYRSEATGKREINQYCTLGYWSLWH